MAGSPRDICLFACSPQSPGDTWQLRSCHAPEGGCWSLSDTWWPRSCPEPPGHVAAPVQSPATRAQVRLWAHLYFQSYISNFPVLADNSFPDQTGRRIRCTSYGQALYSLTGSKLNLKDALGWFKVFYRGLDNPIFFPYAAFDSFENPITFRLDSFADDDITRHLYSIMIRPCFLPVGMSTSNRIIKPGYESYQPVVVAQQLGLGQVPPHFFLHHLTESRADLPDLVTSQKCYSLFDDLHTPIHVNLSFTFSTNGFGTWWSMWKDHIF
jgi:hypothetical protein